MSTEPFWSTLSEKDQAELHGLVVEELRDQINDKAKEECDSMSRGYALGYLVNTELLEAYDRLHNAPMSDRDRIRDEIADEAVTDADELLRLGLIELTEDYDHYVVTPLGQEVLKEWR